jgi:hypothetical protein
MFTVFAVIIRRVRAVPAMSAAMFRQSSANGDGNGENDRKERFHGTKYSILTPRVRLPGGRRDCAANRRFKFQKSRQLFIRVHNETLSLAAMCVRDKDRSPVGIHGCNTAQLTRAMFGNFIGNV